MGTITETDKVLLLLLLLLLLMVVGLHLSSRRLTRHFLLFLFFLLLTHKKKGANLRHATPRHAKLTARNDHRYKNVLPFLLSLFSLYRRCCCTFPSRHDNDNGTIVRYEAAITFFPFLLSLCVMCDVMVMLITPYGQCCRLSL